MDDQKHDKGKTVKGLGAQFRPDNRFARYQWIKDPEHVYDAEEQEALMSETRKTSYLEVDARTIVNKVDSPDLGFAFSLNPYQGCEHGCIYCYARNSHEFWGGDAGTGFEREIQVKTRAPELLEEWLRKYRGEPQPLALAGNTDIYQPAERHYGITRRMIQVLARYRYPFSLTTKNPLILRDLDLLQPLAEQQLVRVALSITTLDPELKRILEPRTGTATRLLDACNRLTAAGIPVSILIAPVIPSINDHEMHDIAAAASQAGARNIGYQVLRLNGAVLGLFEDWLDRHYPDRKQKVMSKVIDLHGGQANDSRFGIRFKGEGVWSDLFAQRMALLRRQYFPQPQIPPYNLSLFGLHRDLQYKLF